MLGLFRKNLFVNVIILLLFVIVLRSYFFIYGEPSNISWSINEILNLNVLLGNTFLQVAASIILIFFQAYLLSSYVIEHRLSRELSLISGAVFILFVSSVLEPQSFNIILIANFFFVLSLGSLFKIYKKHKPIGTIFNSGFYLGLATVFYFPYIIFFIPLLFGLLSLRSFNFKELLQLISGLLGVYFLVAVFLFYNDHLHVYNDHMYSGFSLPSFDFSDPFALIKPGLLLVSSIFLLVFQNTLRKKKKFDAIKKIELVYWCLFLGLIVLIFTLKLGDEALILISCPIAILGGLILESKDKSIYKEIGFVVLIVAYVLFLMNVI